LYNDESASLNVLIAYHNESGKEHILSVCGDSAYQGEYGLKRLHVILCTITQEQLDELLEDENVDYMEHDANVTLYGEIIPYGLEAIQGNENSLPASTTTADCDDPNSFKVAVVDTGLERTHPDISCRSNNCKGRSFGFGVGEWYSPSDSHGTMVAGIIGASRGNGLGVAGVVDGSGICWIIARVFGDSTSGETSISAVLDGVEWAAEQGAQVINMSLGGPIGSFTGQRLYQELYDDGVLIVAASGNSGTSADSYPASYDSVMSVGAVDEENQWARFSQYNDNVDVVAPGVAVLSTGLLKDSSGSVTFVSVGNDKAVAGIPMEQTASANSESGPLVDCQLGTSPCSSSVLNFVCLMQRYVVTRVR
jgi:serine protease